MLTDFGPNINVKVLNDTDGGTTYMRHTSCSKGRKPTPGQGLWFALRLALIVYKGLTYKFKEVF